MPPRLPRPAAKADAEPWADWIVAARDGTAAARERLFIPLLAWWLPLAWRVLRDEQVARDVVQDACVRLLRGLHRFDPARCPGGKGWLFRLLVNCAWDHVRRRRRFPASVEADPPAPAGEGPDEVAERRERADLVRRLLDGLPRLEGEALRLRFAAGLTYQQIGDRLGVSRNAAYRAVNVALRRRAGRAGGARRRPA